MGQMVDTQKKVGIQRIQRLEMFQHRRAQQILLFRRNCGVSTLLLGVKDLLRGLGHGFPLRLFGGGKHRRRLRQHSLRGFRLAAPSFQPLLPAWQLAQSNQVSAARPQHPRPSGLL